MCYVNCKHRWCRLKNYKQKPITNNNLILFKLELFPYLKKKDLRSARPSEPGSDIKLLSLTARKLFPYDVECKNREEYKTIYNHFKQCTGHGKLESLLVIKMNREKPLCIIDIDHFFNPFKIDFLGTSNGIDNLSLYLTWPSLVMNENSRSSTLILSMALLSNFSFVLVFIIFLSSSFVHSLVSTRSIRT